MSPWPGPRWSQSWKLWWGLQQLKISFYIRLSASCSAGIFSEIELRHKACVLLCRCALLPSVTSINNVNNVLHYYGMDARAWAWVGDFSRSFGGEQSHLSLSSPTCEKNAGNKLACAPRHIVFRWLQCALSDRVFRRRSVPTVDPHLCCDSVSASCETDSIMGSNYKLDKDAFSRRLKRLYDLWRVSRTLCLQFSPADNDRSRRRRFQC